jgi:hypothetical protein
MALLTLYCVIFYYTKAALRNPFHSIYLTSRYFSSVVQRTSLMIWWLVRGVRRTIWDLILSEQEQTHWFLIGSNYDYNPSTSY